MATKSKTPASKSTELTDATSTQVSTPKTSKTMVTDNPGNPNPAVNNDNTDNSTDNDNLKNTDNDTTSNTLFAEETVSVTQPKQQRIGKQQRRLDYEEYRTTFLSPVTICDRHQITISVEMWRKLERVARILGDHRSTVAGFAESIFRHHFAIYGDDIEAWRKL